MAIVNVQAGLNNFTNGANTVAKAYTTNPVTGNALIAMVGCYNGAPALTISDTLGSTWVQATQEVLAANWSTTIFYVASVSNPSNLANTVTTNVTQAGGAGGLLEIVLYEFSFTGGAFTLGPVNGNQSQSASTSLSSGAITTTVAASLLIGYGLPGGAVTGGEGGSWVNTITSQSSGAEYLIATSIQTGVAATWTMTSGTQIATIASFYVALRPGPITGTMLSSGVVTARLIGATFVQGQFSSSTTTASVAVTFTSSQTAGNLNIVFIGSLLSGLTITSITDSHSQTYTKAIGPISQAGIGADVLQGWIYYSPNIAAGSNTITVLFGAANNFPEIFILEYSGLATSSPLDVTGSASGASGTSSVSVTTTNPNDIIVAGFFNDGTGWDGTPGAGFTNRLHDSGSANQIDDASETSSGAYTDTPTNLGGSWLGIAAAFKAAGASTILRPGPITGTMTSLGAAFARVPIRVPITGSMISSGVVHGTAHTPFLMFSSGAVTVHTVRRQPPIPGVMLSSGVVVPRLIGKVFPMSKGSMVSSGVITLRLNPLRVPVTGKSTSSGAVNPHVGIIRPTALGRSTSSGVVIPELIFRPAIIAGPITGFMLSTGGQTNPRTVTRAPVTGSSSSSGVVMIRLREFPTAFGAMLSSGVVTPRLIGTVFPTAFGTMRSSGVLNLELQPTRITLATRTMLMTGRVNVNLVTPIKPPIIVAATGYYALIDTWGGNLVELLTAGVNYSTSVQTILGGPYASYWIGIQAMIAILEAIPET